MGNASELNYATVSSMGLLFFSSPEQGNYCPIFVHESFPFSILSSFKREIVGYIL